MKKFLLILASLIISLTLVLNQAWAQNPLDPHITQLVVYPAHDITDTLFIRVDGQGNLSDSRITYSWDGNDITRCLQETREAKAVGFECKNPTPGTYSLTLNASYSGTKMSQSVMITVATPIPTVTVTATPVPTITVTITPTVTDTPTNTPTITPTTATPTVTATITPTIPTATSTPTIPTATPVPTIDITATMIAQTATQQAIEKATQTAQAKTPIPAPIAKYPPKQPEDGYVEGKDSIKRFHWTWGDDNLVAQYSDLYFELQFFNQEGKPIHLVSIEADPLPTVNGAPITSGISINIGQAPKKDNHFFTDFDLAWLDDSCDVYWRIAVAKRPGQLECEAPQGYKPHEICRVSEFTEYLTEPTGMIKPNVCLGGGNGDKASGSPNPGGGPLP